MLAEDQGHGRHDGLFTVLGAADPGLVAGLLELGVDGEDLLVGEVLPLGVLADFDGEGAGPLGVRHPPDGDTTVKPLPRPGVNDVLDVFVGQAVFDAEFFGEDLLGGRQVPRDPAQQEQGFATVFTSQQSPRRVDGGRRDEADRGDVGGDEPDVVFVDGTEVFLPGQDGVEGEGHAGRLTRSMGGFGGDGVGLGEGRGGSGDAVE